MNERIRELAQQANPDIFKEFDQEDIDFCRKFAELIVKECIAVHEDDYGVDIIGDLLKKHFGVEE